MTYTGLSPPVKYFTDRTKAVLLLWIFYVFFCLAINVLLCASVYMCLVVTCWEKADLLALVYGVLLRVCRFPICILGQVWLLIVSIHDLCILTYFGFNYKEIIFCKCILLGMSACMFQFFYS